MDKEAADACNSFYIEKVIKLNGKLKDSITDNPEADNANCVGTALVKRALAELKPKVAIGVEDILITVIKAAWDPLAIIIVHLINCIVKTGN
ncbi:Hypothetical protein FKW44_008473 [Caligus rogercresseyi]|uniref:Uncharacterized protein n=1 Tax=Caligus rogercresseyi TaxID=217165 RepID=A0A7T8KG63_CALRO|nr:Hypothetical protein FKW44_008473 [Caligus rogercresseyi]